MKAFEIDRMFNFTFEKSSGDIVAKAKAKIETLKAKVQEREGRVALLRKEYGIDDAVLSDLLIQARRAISEERTVGAGVVNNLLTENDFIESEKDSIKRLETMARNLGPLSKWSQNGLPYAVDSFPLSYAEAEYLGF